MVAPLDSPLSTPFFSPWAQGPVLYSRWLIGALDAQTTLWREMERQTSALMQLWFDPAMPPPSAQFLADAARGLAPLGPVAWQRAWSGWARIWADAMRHDAAQT
jgi:hypothetical protein